MTATNLTLTLEWFLNPDHLPFIAGLHTQAYERAGLSINIIEPSEHYDGFAELAAGNIDLHINEPIHLFEHYFADLKSLGCFFETDGGVMLRQESTQKLINNQPIRITTPAANAITNKIGFDILRRYAKKQGCDLNRDTVQFVETNFQHLENLKQGEFDGAWLCFYNFEGIEAQHEALDNVFIDQSLAAFPNFSALELMTTHNTWQQKQPAISRFVEVTNEMTMFCINNADKAREAYYSYTNSTASALMDDIINDTLKRFIVPIQADSERWQALRNYLAELNIAKLTDEQYQQLW
ncbi:ABC transporter substrate-binding protein [Psychrobacter pygoscelis]|uniref:ABC transporter substrate-binding protein n=1 Tax=Psychrobacter pygoscelis TaxID=2488563 RepID=UPI0013F4B41E|nr:ABC transporter substrate-binding protein [Psychrobacter pygoscelis]